MNVQLKLKHIRDLANTNSPVILTGLAVGGACLTTYLAIKGAFKASEVLNEESASRHVDRELMTNQDKFVLTYKFYAPAAVTLVGTSACMVMATKIGLNRTAAMAGALAITQRGNDQYRDKVKELLGEKKNIAVNDGVAQDQVANTATPTIIMSGTDQLFFDRWSGRYFPSTMEKVNQALNDFNKDMLYGHYCSLSEFYSRIGLEDTTQSDDIGWNSRDPLLELVFTTVLKDDKAVVAFAFEGPPTPGFRKGLKST